MSEGGGAARSCESCGASAPRAEARYCEQCGSPLPVVQEPAPAPRVHAAGDAAARFRALERHPELPRLLAETPSTSELAAWNLVTVVTLVVFALVGVFVSIGFFYVCPPLGLLPLALVAIGLYVISRHVVRNARASRAPLERRPALVFDLRTRVSSGGEHTSARTTTFATLEFPDGSRQEREALESLAGRLAPGDMGVAYLKGPFLIAFERLEA